MQLVREFWTNSSAFANNTLRSVLRVLSDARALGVLLMVSSRESLTTMLDLQDYFHLFSYFKWVQNYLVCYCRDTVGVLKVTGKLLSFMYFWLWSSVHFFFLHPSDSVEKIRKVAHQFVGISCLYSQGVLWSISMKGTVKACFLESTMKRDVFWIWCTLLVFKE